MGVPEGDAPVVRLEVPRGVVDGDRGGDTDQLCGSVNDAVVVAVVVGVAVVDGSAPGDRVVVADAVGCGQ